MSTPGLGETDRAAKIGPLAAAAGLGPAECAAIRRHAERQERGDANEALETYRVAILVEPGEAANWLGAARCLERLGMQAEARGARKVAERFKERFG